MTAIETDAAELREIALGILAAYDQRDAILAQAAQADRADEKQLAALRAQLHTHESACDPDKLEHFQLSAALRSQLAAKENQVAADKVSRARDARTKAQDAVEAANFHKFLVCVQASEFEKAKVALAPFYETPARVEQAALECDAVVFVGGLSRAMAHPMMTNQQAAAMLPRLKRFVAGGRLWGPLA